MPDKRTIAEVAKAWIDSRSSPFFKTKHLRKGTGLKIGHVRIALRELQKQGYIVKFNKWTWRRCDRSK